MGNIYGDWKKTLGATMHVLSKSKDGNILTKTNGTIYGNDEHVAIIKVMVTFGDEKGNELQGSLGIDGDVLRKTITFIQFDNSTNDTPLAMAGTPTDGWNLLDDKTCFTCVMPDDDVDEDQDPIFILDSELMDNVVAPTSTLYFKIRYKKRNQKADAPLYLGLKIWPEPDDGIDTGIEPYYIAKKREHGEPENLGINLTAITPLEYSEKDFDWEGVFIDHQDGDDDDFVRGLPPEGQFWREVSYKVTLKLSEEEAGQDFYDNKIFRISMKNNSVYGQKGKIGKVESDYSFGYKRNGFYNFRGFFWPYNLYPEDKIREPSAEPFLAPPQHSRITTYSAPLMYDNGLPPVKPTIDYSKHAAHLSLLCTFGFTSNNAWWDNSLYLDIFDQYGNKGSVCVDQTLIPILYDRTGDQTSLSKIKYFSKDDVSSHTEDGETDNNNNVTIQLVSTKYITEDGKGLPLYLYLGGVDSDDDAIPYLSSSPDYTGTSHYYFRPFRQNFKPGKADDTPVLHNITYNINSFDLELTSLYYGANWATTRNSLDINTEVWRFVPIWRNNSMAIYSLDEDRYLSADSGGPTGYRVSMVRTGGASTLEWVPIVITDEKYVGEPDKGETGYDPSILDNEGEHGRNFWVGVSNLTMLLEGAGNEDAIGYIYPNGLNQAEINVTFTALDSEGKPLSASRRPCNDYLLNSITLIDYYTLNHISKEPDNNGWAFTTKANDFASHTVGGPSGFFQVDRAVVVRDDDVPDDGTVELKYYVTCSSGRPGLKRTIGLRLEITDDTWGDPIVYTCSNENGDDGHNQNFLHHVTVATKDIVEYTKDNVAFQLIATNPGPCDDTWPITNDGPEDVTNLWRLLHYEATISNGIYPATIYQCSVGSDIFEAETLNKGKCFSRKCRGVYSTEAWLWPTNLTDVKGGRIKGSDETGPFSLGHYGATVVNENSSPDDPIKDDDKPFYVSVYYEFAGDDYGYEYKTEYINITIYDQYGNRGRFHFNPNFYQEIYDPTKADKVEMLYSGWTNVAPATETYTAEWQINCIDDNDEDKVAKIVGLKSWDKDKCIWTVHVGDSDASKSLFQLQFKDGYYRFRHKGDTYLTYSGSGKSRPLGAEFDDGSDRFELVLKPVWNQRAFLIGTASSADSSRAFQYSFDSNTTQNCLYNTIAPNDTSFVWTLLPYNDN